MSRCSTCLVNPTILVNDAFQDTCYKCCCVCPCCQCIFSNTDEDFCNNCKEEEQTQKQAMDLQVHIASWLKRLNHIPFHKQFDERLRLYVGIRFDGTHDDCITYLEYLILLYQKRMKRVDLVECRRYLARLKWNGHYSFNVQELDVAILTLISKSL